MFFPVSITKLIVLSIFSFGLYEAYWIYRNWLTQKARTGEDISPFWRTMFTIPYCYYLFKRVQATADAASLHVQLQPGALFILFHAILIIGSFLPDPYSLAASFFFLPLIPVQAAINKINQQLAPEAPRNSQFTLGNLVLIIAGAALYCLYLLLLWNLSGSGLMSGDIEGLMELMGN